MIYPHGLRFPDGSKEHLPCCGVVAIATAAEVPFQNVWNLIGAGKRSTWKGYLSDEEISENLQKLHVSYRRVPLKFVMSLRDFAYISADHNRNKVFIVRTYTHFIVVRNTEVVDQYGVCDIEGSRFRRTLVKEVWEILSNNPEKAVDVTAAVTYTNVTNKTERNYQMSKIEQAKALYAANSTLTRKEMIALFVDKLGLTPAAASTYQNTAKKAFEAGAPAPAVEAIEEVKPTTAGALKKAEAAKPAKRVAKESSDKLHDLSREEVYSALDPETQAEVDRLEQIVQARESETAN